MTTATGRPPLWWRAKKRKRFVFLDVGIIIVNQRCVVVTFIRKKLRIVHECQEKKISCDDVRLLFTSMCGEKASKMSGISNGKLSYTLCI